MDATLATLKRFTDFFGNNSTEFKAAAQDFSDSLQRAIKRLGDAQTVVPSEDATDWQEHVRRLEVEMFKLRHSCTRDANRLAQYEKLLNGMTESVTRLRNAVALHLQPADCNGNRYHSVYEIVADFVEELDTMFVSMIEPDDGTGFEGSMGSPRPDSDIMDKPKEQTLEEEDLDERALRQKIGNFSFPSRFVYPSRRNGDQTESLGPPGDNSCTQTGTTHVR
jgi:hypothetical protein